MFTIIDRRLSPHFAPMSILEYGCGVGRLALPLARRACGGDRGRLLARRC